MDMTPYATSPPPPGRKNLYPAQESEGTQVMTPTAWETFLWVIIPYLALASFILGHIWRYRYDKLAGPPAPRRSMKTSCYGLVPPYFTTASSLCSSDTSLD